MTLVSVPAGVSGKNTLGVTRLDEQTSRERDALPSVRIGKGARPPGDKYTR